MVNVQVETLVLLRIYVYVLVRLHDIEQYRMAASLAIFGLNGT